jgi:UDP-N-acetyl-D-glucosamine dehydrogenase
VTAASDDGSLWQNRGMSARKLVVIGQGYVGLPLAMRAVEVGYDVVGLEVDKSRVDRLAGGESYVEDIPSEQLAANLATGRYAPSLDYQDARGFDVAVITVPTPLREGNPDLSYIEDSGRSLAPLLRPGATVVLESTTYPGTTEELLAPLLEAGSGLIAGKDFSLGYSPERIDPGNPTHGLVNTPKVVSGVDPASLAAVQGFFDDIVERTVPVSSPKEAELTKLLENTFRHVNIALVNELAVFAHDLGINVWEAIDAASTKPFGYLRFTPGPGVGGHCLPIDPSYLSWQVKRTLGHSFRFVELANDVNDHMPDYVVQRVTELLNRQRKSVNGSTVLLLGLAYKKGTSDARESPSVRVAQLLAARGAQVRFADPLVDLSVVQLHEPLPARQVELTSAEAEAADVVVLLVDHDEFDLDLLDGVTVFDTRRTQHDSRWETL